MPPIIMSSGMVQHRILAFEILHLFAHHGKVKLNEVLMTADDSQEVKFELVQHLNVDQTTTLTSRSAITAKLCCSVCKLWQKYKYVTSLYPTAHRTFRNAELFRHAHQLLQCSKQQHEVNVRMQARLKINK